MPDLVHLSTRALDLATRPARFAFGTLLRFVRDQQEEPLRAAPAPAPPPSPEPAAEQPQTAAPVAPPPPSPKAARRAARHEPTRGQAAAIREHQREEEQHAGGAEPGVGATIEVAEPWAGYASMSEEQVLERLSGADDATRAAVRLYEGFNANRQQIIFATETLTQP